MAQGQGVTTHGDSRTRTIGTQMECVALVKTTTFHHRAVRLLLVTDLLQVGDAKDLTAPGETLREDVVAGTTQGQGVTTHGNSQTRTIGMQIKCAALVKTRTFHHLLLVTTLHLGDAKDPTAPGETLREDVVAGTTQGQGVTTHG